MDNKVKVVATFFISCISLFLLDVSSISKVKEELYKVADSINRDITRYGCIREEIKENLKDNYLIEVIVDEQDENLLTYTLLKSYSPFTIISRNKKVAIQSTVWVNYL